MSDTTRESAKTQFNLRLTDDLLTQVDARAKNLNISRNEWFANMTRWVLANTKTVTDRGGKP